MRRFIRLLSAFVLIAGFSVFSCDRLTASAATQSDNWSTSACGDDEGNTHNNWGWGHQERVCELRTTTFKLGGGHMDVKSENGGIDVQGADRGDVLVEARVQAWAGSSSEASDILKQVRIETSGDSIRDDGPKFFLGNRGYAVNYRLHVPRRLAVDLKSMNGGIDIAHLEGEIHFGTTNGGVSLRDLAGDVHGRTVNGGLDIRLSGDHWRGDGMDAETTNGGVTLTIPASYSAHLETGTVNGGIELNFPITIQGSIKNHLSTNLGSGGATIRAQTTNGGIRVNRAPSVSASL